MHQRPIARRARGQPHARRHRVCRTAPPLPPLSRRRVLSFARLQALRLGTFLNETKPIGMLHRSEEAADAAPSEPLILRLGNAQRRHLRRRHHPHSDRGLVLLLHRARLRRPAARAKPADGGQAAASTTPPPPTTADAQPAPASAAAADVSAPVQAEVADPTPPASEAPPQEASAAAPPPAAQSDEATAEPAPEEQAEGDLT